MIVNEHFLPPKSYECRLELPSCMNEAAVDRVQALHSTEKSPALHTSTVQTNVNNTPSRKLILQLKAPVLYSTAIVYSSRGMVEIIVLFCRLATIHRKPNFCGLKRAPF